MPNYGYNSNTFPNFDFDTTFIRKNVKQKGIGFGFGSNGGYNLGDGTNNNRLVPTIIGNNTAVMSSSHEWIQLAAGGSFSLGIRANGSLWSWGNDSYGAQGVPSGTSLTGSPIQTTAGGNNWVQIAAGGNHAAAIKGDNSLWTWGRNTYGQLGVGNTTDRSSAVQVTYGGNNWIKVVCGQNHTVALTANGTLWTWGDNQYGQLGDGTVTAKSIPVLISSANTLYSWKQIGAGSTFSVAIRSDKTLWKLGGTFSTLGQTPTIQNIGGSLIQVSAGIQSVHYVTVRSNGTIYSSNTSLALSGNGWRQATMGGIGDTISAIKVDGTLWTTINLDPQLVITSNSANSTIPTNNWISITSGGTNVYGSFTLALKKII